jgi:hypothetical protein
MTTNASNQPNHTPQQNGYHPITFDDVQKPTQSSVEDLFRGLTSPVPRWAAAPLFGFLFFYTERMPFLAPLTILILLSCLLSRMENDVRKIAAVPLTLSAIKLSFEMSSQLAYNFWVPGAPGSSNDVGFLWLPIFFSVCLVFIPLRESVTFRIVLAASCLLLASGLLPGQGFLCIFYLIDYLLFIAIVVGIFVDLKTYLPTQARSRLGAAH